MANKLREIFCGPPSGKTQQQIKAVTERAYAEEWCCTCQHCIPDDPHTPWFVTTGPECELTGKPAMKHCSDYKRMADTQDRLRGWL